MRLKEAVSSFKKNNSSFLLEFYLVFVSTASSAVQKTGMPSEKAPREQQQQLSPKSRVGVGVGGKGVSILIHHKDRDISQQLKSGETLIMAPKSDLSSSHDSDRLRAPMRGAHSPPTPATRRHESRGQHSLERDACALVLGLALFRACPVRRRWENRLVRSPTKGSAERVCANGCFGPILHRSLNPSHP